MNATIIYLIVYILLLGYLTWSSVKKQTDSDFINSSKRLSTNESVWTTFASLLTGYNFVIGVTFSYLFGFYYLFAFVGAALAFVVLYYFYKKHLSKLQENHNLFSPGDYFGIRFGKSTKYIANSVLVIGLFLFLILQLSVNTQLFAGLLGTGKTIALIITTGVVCIYLWFGGFKASVRTDILQGILLIPIVLAVFTFPSNFSLSNISIAVPEGQFWFAIGLAGLQFLTLVAQAESFQRIFAVKNAKVLKKGLIYSFILLALVAGAIAYIGINFLLSGNTVDPNSLFVDGVLPTLSPQLSAILSISLIAAFMGTIDSSAFAIGTLLAKSVTRIRIAIISSVILSALASVYLFSFLSAVFALISVVSVIGTAVIVSLFKYVKKIEINVLLLTGISVFILGLLFDFVTDNPLTALIPSGVGLLAMLLVFVFNRFISKN